MSNIFEQFAAEYNSKSDNFSKDKYVYAAEMIESMEALGIFEQSMMPLATTDYLTNQQKLRAGNYIESILAADEGMSNSDIAMSVYYATQAKNISSSAYPNDVNKQDAYRHFSWNFIMADNWDQYKARTFGNNHEWGLILLTPILNYYDDQYNKYLNQGYSDKNAAETAFIDATLYIPTLKYYTVNLCEGSFANFKALFTTDNIMDLYNNCYGRAATASYSSYSTAFNDAWNDGDLVKSKSSVTNTHYNNVWAWDWYTY